MPQTFSVGSRSRLVNLTAWLVIVLALLALVSSLLPAVAQPWPALPGPLADRLGPAADWVAQLADHRPWLLGAGALSAAALLACAVGLLRRLEWARRLAIGVLALMLCGQLAGLWLQHEVVAAVLDASLHRMPLPDVAAGALGGLAWAAQAMAWLLTLGGCALLVWLMLRLSSAPVRQEFA